MKIYIASPLDKNKRENLFEAIKILREEKSLEVIVPLEYTVINAWDYPNNEWGLMVFTHDTDAIREADFIVVLNYGRQDTTSGTVAEQAFAFALGKKVLLVEMTDAIQSLITANMRYATVKGLQGLRDYDFDDPKPLRVDTEQK
jgi:nucleoside 2-deoxyribosyltransferase